MVNVIKRDILPPLESHLEAREITLLVGPRQAGKTFVMRLLQQKLDNEGKKTLFLNLDLDENREFFTSQTILLKKIKLNLGETRGYVFIDEIQRRENAGLFLKGLFDMDLPYKFIVSGSGSLELKEKIHESLVGRKRLFEVTPLTFTEFVNFRTGYRYQNKLPDFFSLEQSKSLELLNEYLMFGGYPKVVLAETASEKQAVMAEIYQGYLEKDIKNLLNIDKSESLTNLVKILASQIGGPINVSELSSTVGIAGKTIKKYLWYLEKTFIIARISPYFRNVRKEVTKAPVYYFYDLGLRNYTLGLFGVSGLNLDGHLFENFVFHRIRQQLGPTSAQIHYWRTRDGAEVDFVIDTGTELLPIEVKFNRVKKGSTTRSFNSFLGKYQPKTAFIVHLGKSDTTKIGRTSVFIVPFYQNFIAAAIAAAAIAAAAIGRISS